MTLVDAISEALNTEFGENYEIYTEDVEQELTTPCFLIETVETSGGQYLGRKQKRENSFCLHYFPDSAEASEECRQVSERLFELMELLPFGDGKIRGKNMKAKVEDDVLHFFVDYDRFMVGITETDMMTLMNVDIDMKGEK